MDLLPAAFHALNAYPQFIVYVLIPSKKRINKMEKIPVDYRTGRIVNAHDAAFWTDATTAIKHAKLLGTNYGVGFTFTANDPFWFLDIDDCLILNNTQYSPVALQVLNLFAGAAIEVSNSRKGLHIIGCGNVGAHNCKNKEFNLEFYTQERFVALTGFKAIGDAGKDFTSILPHLINQYFITAKTNQIAHWSNTPCAEWNGPADDTVLINRAVQSYSARSVFSGGASFRDLWENNIEVLEKAYKRDASSYDAALAQHLAFWTGNDCERMLNLMRQSKLNREKWEREDYLPRTILNACAKQKEWLRDKITELPFSTANTDAVKSTRVTTNTFLSVDQQIELFKGCIYLRDEHKILVPGGEILKADQFRSRFGGYSFAMDLENMKMTRNAWEAFNESQAFHKPQADSSCFRPHLSPGAIIYQEGKTLANLWWPVETQRKKGDANLFLNHIAKIIPEPRDQLIILSFMAACVQYKGIKFQWAPLIQGVEGNGKTLLGECIAAAIGRKYCHFPNAAEITEKYNDWMYKKLFIGVEDIYIADSQREVLETLKPWITREWLEIRAMHSGKIMRDVCCNFILNSNHKDGIRKTRNDRRFAPFFCAQQEKKDLQRDGLTGNYFPNLWRWLQQEGFAIVSEFLHTFNIPDEFNPANKKPAPITSSTEAAIMQGLSLVEQEILEAVDQGLMGFSGGWISSIFLDKLLARLNLDKRIPHNKRRELLQSLGYNLHPALCSGRADNIVLPDGGKPRLFLRVEHPALNITCRTEITRLYTEAQKF